MENYAVFSVDSDLGKGIADLHQSTGAQVQTYSRRKPEHRYFDVLHKSRWPVPERCNRVYYTVAGTATSQSELEAFNITALASVRFLQYIGQRMTSPTEFVVLSSYLGSIACIDQPVDIVYRMGKAALNMGVRCLSKQLPQHKWVLVNPGLVATKMTALALASGTYPHQGRAMTVASASEKLVDFLATPSTVSGEFYDSEYRTTIKW
jgi:hypothetical protein